MKKGRGKLNSNQQLEIKSTNPNYPVLLDRVVHEFIFKNSQPLNDSQKCVVYEMALEYFCGTTGYLSDVLLLCLVKIAPNYMNIYAD